MSETAKISETGLEDTIGTSKGWTTMEGHSFSDGIEPTESTTETAIETDQHEKFQKDALVQMERIYNQIQRLQKIALRRGVEYTEEDVEKMFGTLEKYLADCKDVYMKKFEPDGFHFKF